MDEIPDIDFSQIKWRRMLLNAVAIAAIVFAAAWGDPNTLFLAIKAGVLAGILSAARELQDFLKPPKGNDNAKTQSPTRISSFLLI